MIGTSVKVSRWLTANQFWWIDRLCIKLSQWMVSSVPNRVFFLDNRATIGIHRRRPGKTVILAYGLFIFPPDVLIPRLGSRPGFRFDVPEMTAIPSIHFLDDGSFPFPIEQESSMGPWSDPNEHTPSRFAICPRGFQAQATVAICARRRSPDRISIPDPKRSSNLSQPTAAIAGRQEKNS